MKNQFYLLLLFSLMQTFVFGQTVEFTDDFESGTGNWVLEGTWGETTAQANSGTTSLTDSPGADYAANLNISATLATGIDLSTALDAGLTFSAIYDIENGNFDYFYVEASTDDGATWINVATIFGEGNLTPWTQYDYSLGGFVDNDNVKIRFRLFTDGGYEVDGIYIDDVEIWSNSTDNAAPLIIHDAPEHYESSLGDVTMTAELVDISGISSTSLTYSVDGGSGSSVTGTNTGGNMYEYVIPTQDAGLQVDYFISATDNSADGNSADTPTASYIAGDHVFYDNGVVDFVNSFGPDAASALLGCAVQFTLDEADIKYALIRNYTDSNRPNSPFMFHVWNDEAGLPGNDMIVPFAVDAEANLDITSPMTRIDLSDYSAELSNITGDVYMGYTVDEGQTWLVQTSPGVGLRSYTFDGAAWTIPTVDFHFRLVTTPNDMVAVDNTEFNAAIDVFPNPAREKATIQASFEGSRNLQVQVFNAVNQLVWVDVMDNTDAVNFDINLQHFVNGVYFIQFTDGTHQAVRRLVVNK